MNDTSSTMELYRHQIDELDEQLMDCLRRRAHCVRLIAKLKRQSGFSVVQSQRAEAVARHFRELASAHQLRPEFAQRLFDLIHEESCREQTNWISTAADGAADA